MDRRKILKTLAVTPFLMNFKDLSELDSSPNFERKGNINHSVCRWIFSEYSIEELCIIVKKLGFNAIDLVEPKDFKTLKKHEVYSSMCTGAHISLEKGFCDKQYHNKLVENYKKHINLVADAGYKNLICFSGNGNGIDSEKGLINMTEGIKRILSLAEKKGVTLQIELFNTKVDHKGYMANSTDWGIQLCKNLSSDNFKILYDIYHMQIMEGNIIDTIRKNYQYFGHYHTAGVPGRNEIDNTQELNYKPIIEAIYKTGFKGYLAQEFIPKSKDKVESLHKAIQICDV